MPKCDRWIPQRFWRPWTKRMCHERSGAKGVDIPQTLWLFNWFRGWSTLCPLCYRGWLFNITTQNHHFLSLETHYKWQFSVAMLVYQRVLWVEAHMVTIPHIIGYLFHIAFRRFVPIGACLGEKNTCHPLRVLPSGGGTPKSSEALGHDLNLEIPEAPKIASIEHRCKGFGGHPSHRNFAGFFTPRCFSLNKCRVPKRKRINGGSCDPRTGRGWNMVKPKGWNQSAWALVYYACCYFLTLQGCSVEECNANVVVSSLLGGFGIVFLWQVEI